LKVSFNRPILAGQELYYVADAVQRGHLSGDGYYTELCQNRIAGMISARAALLTHSCTAALEMAALLLDLKEGDEVIMPSFTFVSTANAVALRGATPVFVDIRPDTLNIDERLVEGAVTERTKAIFPVHYAGVPAEMNELDAVATKHDLAIVEDAAQALGSTYRDRPAGRLGSLAAVSFHETKNIISGEGGALVIRDERFIERAEIIREKGTNRKLFFRGQVDKYTWVDLGSSYLPSELIAAFLLAQLEHFDDITGRRLSSWRKYDAVFRGYHNRGLRTPFVPDHVTHNGHLYYIMLPSLELRQEFIAGMKEDGIMTPFHYVPLHNAPAAERFARSYGDLSVTMDVSDKLVRLPLHPQIDKHLDRVIEVAVRHLNRLL